MRITIRSPLKCQKESSQLAVMVRAHPYLQSSHVSTSSHGVYQEVTWILEFAIHMIVLV